MTGPSSPESETERKAVVVGLDGSEHAHRALAWAAANTDGPVCLVVSWNTPWWGVSTPLGGTTAPAPPPDSYFEESSKQIISEAQALLGDTPTVPSLIRRGHAGQTLVEAGNSRGRLLVVGSRGRGAITSLLLGSVSAYCASKSEVPVVIVPEGTDPASSDQTTAKKVVVGVDGSENSVAALLWAIDNAPAEATILALGAWAPPMSYDGVLLMELDDLEQRHHELVNAVVERARTARPGTERVIDIDVQMGDARQLLRTTDADQVVVGARGHRGLEYLMLGSTASALAHQPLVPTVIVPSSDTLA